MKSFELNSITQHWHTIHAGLDAQCHVKELLSLKGLNWSGLTSFGLWLQGDLARLHLFVNSRSHGLSREADGRARANFTVHCMQHPVLHRRNHWISSGRAEMTSRRPWRREMDGVCRRKIKVKLTAGEQEARGQRSDTGVARHDGITTGRCAAVVRLNSGLNLRPARPARPLCLHLCQHPSYSCAVNHLHLHLLPHNSSLLLIPTSNLTVRYILLRSFMWNR